LKSFEHLIYSRSCVRSNRRSIGTSGVAAPGLSVVAVRHLFEPDDQALLPQELTMSTIILTPTATTPAVRRTAHPTARQAVRPVAPRSSVRLTRRGRAVVFLLGLVVALVAGFVLANGSTATEHSEPTTVIQVGAGETLWDIAQSVAVTGHTADMVDHIKELNSLTGGALQAGQELRVPAAR
jgi:Tfp pilus assembly protein FimV